jgi:hypothetical protein
MSVPIAAPLIPRMIWPVDPAAGNPVAVMLNYIKI